jgi:uncharacterized membrane protein YkvA (DUF1232 family)
VDVLETWKGWARSLKREVYAMYLAVRDPRVPWYAKVCAAGIVAYAFSPIDLIPDPIPVLGYLDDLIILPLAILAVRRMIPADVLAECRERAKEITAKPTSRIGAAIIVTIWILLAALAVVLTVRWLE